MIRTFKMSFLASVGSSFVASAAKAGARAGAIALGAVVLFGCPVYGGSQGDVVCDSQGNCCDENTGNCSLWNCDYSQQCPSGASCNSGLCVSGSGYDGGYYYGDDGGGYDAGEDADYYPYDAGTDATVDCSTTGCQGGFTCTLTNGIAQCLPTPDGGSDATVPPVEASTPPEAGSHDAGVDAPTLPPFKGCTNDNACVTDSGAGARCLDGKCVAEANECSDSTQCPSVGGAQEQCVSGVCTPSCTVGSSAGCPTGYSCVQNGAESVCTGNPTPCGAADGGAACAKGTTCVDEHCVPDCTAASAGSDAGPSCSGSGLVCVDNGCIPEQAPTFVCAGADGTESTCASGSTCLHHNCYISCSLADAGASDAGNTCRTAGNFNTCKPVTTSTGTFDVCGSSTNLGSECDPTRGIACSDSRICIDGTCY